MKGQGKLSKFISSLKKKLLPSFFTTSQLPPPPPPHVTADEVHHDMHKVYVGKSRREYLITSELIQHPLVQVLMDKTDNSIACEVVLFDHMLWTLKNSDSPQDLEELIEFYKC